MALAIDKALKDADWCSAAGGSRNVFDKRAEIVKIFT
jgi:hypothetical protein